MKIPILIFFLVLYSALRCQSFEIDNTTGKMQTLIVHSITQFNYARKDTMHPVSIFLTEFDTSGKTIHSKNQYYYDNTSREYFYAYADTVRILEKEIYSAYKLRQIKHKRYDMSSHLLYSSDSLWIRDSLWSVKNETRWYEENYAVEYFEKKDINDSVISHGKKIWNEHSGMSVEIDLQTKDTFFYKMRKLEYLEKINEVHRELNRIKYRNTFPQSKTDTFLSAKQDTLLMQDENFIIRNLTKKSPTADWELTRLRYFENGLLKRDEIINGTISNYSYAFY